MSKYEHHLKYKQVISLTDWGVAIFIFASENWVIIGPGNGLLHIQQQSITLTNVDF